MAVFVPSSCIDFIISSWLFCMVFSKKPVCSEKIIFISAIPTYKLESDFNSNEAIEILMGICYASQSYLNYCFF